MTEKINRSASEYYKLMKISEIEGKINRLEIQRCLEDDRVEEIYKDLVRKSEENESMLIPGVIIIGKYKNDLYLLDGQHRVAAFSKLLETQKMDETLMVNFIEFHNEKEIQEQFNIINNSKPASKIPKGVDVTDKDKVASYFYKTYPRIFKSVSKVNRPFISKNKFEGVILLLLKKFSIENAIEKIEEINTELKRMQPLYFHQYSSDSAEKLGRMQSVAIEHGFHIGMSLDLKQLVYLAGGRIMTRIRERLPTALKYKIWKMYYGADHEGECMFCEEEKITEKSCHYAHDTAVAKGGDNTIDNLFPCCSTCNLRAGTAPVEKITAELKLKRRLQS